MFKASRRDRAASEKRKLLRALIDREGDACTNAIIFCNRKTDVDITAKSLKKYGYDAAPIHGDLDQSKRMEVLDGFRAGTLKFLCASDVAARGLDIPNVSHVFNYDVPGHAEDYVHRIGRTGRAGRDGKAIMICEPRDDKNLDAVERLIENKIPRVDNPLGDQPAPARKKDDDTQDSAPSKRSRRGKSDTKPKDAAPAEPAPQPAKEKKQPRARSDRRNQKSDNKVVGMGDHLPDFIAKSFDERRTG